MTSVFPIRYVDKTDLQYQGLPRFHSVLIPKLGGSTAREFFQVAEDLKTGIEAFSLSDSVPHLFAGGQDSPLDFLKEQVALIVSRNSPEWVHGCDGIVIIHHPNKRERLISLLSRLPVSAQVSKPRKLLSVRYKEDLLAFAVDLHENKLIFEDSLIIGLSNHSDPAAEFLVENDRGKGPRFTGLYADKQAMECFAIDALCRVMNLESVYKYEPLGKDTFPDFELTIGGKKWAVEVTRIETGMVTYVPLAREVSRRTIDEVTANPITGSRVRDALIKALTEKTERRNYCSHYSSYCLILIDLVDSVGGEGVAVWNGIDLSGFEAVVIVRLDGTVFFVKGEGTFEPA